MRTVVVTGVSSGIGEAVAAELVQRGYRVFGSVRGQVDGERLAANLGTQFIPLLLDVTDRDAVFRAARQVEATLGGTGLAGLINNAGITLFAPLLHQPIDEVRTQFDTNVIGLISMTQAFLPLLGAKSNAEHPPGRIINVSSTEGRLSTPLMAAYAGTKHAVEGFSAALRRELLLYGIDVVVVRPGPVQTRIQGKAAGHRLASYARTDYAGSLEKFVTLSKRATEGGYTSDVFAVRLVDTFEARRPRTTSTFVRQTLRFWAVPKALPDRTYDRLLGRAFGLLRGSRAASVPPAP